jgi:hypothetical protein
MTELELRIIEAATWILKVNPQFEHNYFRSEELRSIIATNGKIANKYPLVGSDSIGTTAKKRREYLQAKSIPLISLEEAAGFGNLIYTLPWESQLDGGAELYSQGLLDIWEVPAWDTWVTLGASEFKEFSEYPEAVISWVPKSAINLFFSGLSVSIIENMGWPKLNTDNIFLAHLTIKSNKLEFIEMTEQQEEVIINRLQLINGIGYDTPVVESSEEAIIDKSVANNFLRRLKAWFS